MRTILLTGLFLLVLLLAAGCTSGSPAPLPTTGSTAIWRATATPAGQRTAAAQPTQDNPTIQPAASTQPAAAATAALPASLPAPDEWQKLPVISAIPPRAVEIYKQGVAMGNNPRAFSKVGDCGGTATWFLTDFDRGPRFYRLGPYADLQAVIGVFQGSYERSSLAAKSGFNAASLFSPLWANRQLCQPDEGPLACEYRLHRPTLAIIMIGSNDVWHQERFEDQMRRAIEFSIENGVVPVLSTKADNLEGDGSLNATIASLALEYELPLINYWAAVQDLPDQGLQEDGVHLTWAGNRFDDSKAMQRGWPVRNLTTLQMLDAFWQAVEAAP